MEAEAAVKPVEIKKTVAPLMPARISEASYVRHSWRATVEPGITREMIESSEYWQHVAGNFRQGDQISVLSEDMSTYFECLVIGCGNLWANVQVLHVHTLGKVPSKELEFETKWSGPHNKWTVRRGKTVIESGIDNREDAEKKAYELNMANR